MPRVFEKESEEEMFVQEALRAGQRMDDTALVILVGRLLNKPPKEVQSVYMDVKVGIQQVFRDMEGM